MPVKPSNVVRDKKVMAYDYGITDKERDELIDWVATLQVPPALQKTLAKGCDLEAIVDAWCPSCNSRVKVRYPDYRGAAAFIKLLFEYKLQKPSELRQIEHVHRVVPVGELESLTLAELRAAAAGHGVIELEEGDWKELPPAA